ncbi:MAG: EAL domain-containing protein [Methylophagaceae bacterium]
MKKRVFDCENIKELLEIEDKLNSNSDIDLSTGFPNQDKMIQCGRLLFDYLNRSKETGFFCVVQILNIERSYQYGGAVQNLLLWKKILECIEETLPQNAYLGRTSIGVAIHAWGDNIVEEFADTIEQFSLHLENIQFDELDLSQGITPFLATRVGYVVYPEDTGRLENFVPLSRFAALASTDIAPELMMSKSNRFTKQLLDDSSDYIRTEKLLNTSIINGDFIFYYQPQHNLITNKLIGIELLCRWEGNGLLLSKTYDYICMIENGRYITEFTEKSFDKLVAFFITYHTLFSPSFQLSFNISPAIFRWPKFNLVEVIKKELDKHPDLASHLTIEITESAYTNKAISDIAVTNLSQLKDLGVRISIDDFGSGYGALKLLASNIPKCIKLDRELTVEFCDCDEEVSYIRNLIHTANISHLTVLCEGIESLQQREFLISNGVSLGQGYLYSKPLPEDKMISYLKSSFPVIP